jgi:hypothetical protein
MKTQIAIIASLLITSVCCAQDATFTSIQQEFQQKILSLVNETDISPKGLDEKILGFGHETFGSHPKVMQKETLRRFKQLPVFAESELKKYKVHTTLGHSSFSASNLAELSLLLGWDPEKMAGWMKHLILARNLKLSKLARFATLNDWCPDKIYRLETSAHFNLVVTSLGDIFVTKLALTEHGVFEPVSAQWMKRKHETEEQ